MHQQLPTSSRPADGERDVQPRRPHVLVVDDDSTNRRVLQGMLTRLGYVCSTVDDGAKAVAAVVDGSDGQFDAVLMDCLMPVMDGYEATRAIRDSEAARPQVRAHHLPIIAVTALAMQGARERCLEAGMDDYLTKPVMTASLERVLGRWVGGLHAGTSWNAVKRAPVVRTDGPIDVHMLNELMSLGEQAGLVLIADLVRDFGSEVPARFPVMRSALAAGDAPTLLNELHFVAGCASIVGARHVEQLARSVNPSTAPVDMDAAATLVSKLETAYATAFESLKDIVAASKT